MLLLEGTLVVLKQIMINDKIFGRTQRHSIIQLTMVRIQLVVWMQMDECIFRSYSVQEKKKSICRPS